MDLNKHEAYFLFNKEIDQELSEILSIDKANIFFMLTTKILKLNLVTQHLSTMLFLYMDDKSEYELNNISSLFFSDSIVFLDKYFGLVGTQGGKLYICSEEKKEFGSEDNNERVECQIIKSFDMDRIVNIYVLIYLFYILNTNNLLRLSTTPQKIILVKNL